MLSATQQCVSILSLELNISALFNFKDVALFNFQFTLTINRGIKYRHTNEELSAIKGSKVLHFHAQVVILKLWLSFLQLFIHHKILFIAVSFSSFAVKANKPRGSTTKGWLHLCLAQYYQRQMISTVNISFIPEYSLRRSSRFRMLADCFITSYHKTAAFTALGRLRLYLL
jgi:hypothetical protein